MNPINRRAFILAILSSIIISCTKKIEVVQKATDQSAYYTCPMHPEIKQSGPGNCPICGMRLVKVEAKQPDTKEKASDIQSSDRQMGLSGVGKYTVTKKDLVFSIPVSGRLLSSKTIAFQVYESDISAVKKGLEFSGSTNTNEELQGKISEVENLIDPSSRTIRVLGSLDKSAVKSIVEGSFHGEIKGTLKDQIAISEDAVLHTGTKDLVYMISADNKLTPTPVTLGVKAGKEFQVLSGLKEGDIISAGPNFLIDSEAKIRGVQ